MKRIGEDITEVLEYEPGRVWVRRIVRPKYARLEAGLEPGQGQITQAPAKELPFGRSKAGVSLIVHILISKYVEHLPLHRLIARFARSGLKVPPPTIGNWVKTGAEPLMILYEAYQKVIFEAPYLQMDETRLRVLEDGRGKAHLGYLWAVFSPMHNLPFFFYQKGRDHEGPKKFLERFAGVLQCDGYSVYKTLNKKLASIALVNCMAHIRREFFEAQGTDAERAQTTLSMIKILYLVEEKARLQGLNAEQRLELRLKESKPAFDTLGQWLQTEYDKVTPSSAIGKAIQYALNRWDAPTITDTTYAGQVLLEAVSRSLRQHTPSSNRVLRGGRWGSESQLCNAGHRSNWFPANRGSNVGFRLARSLEVGPSGLSYESPVK